MQPFAEQLQSWRAAQRFTRKEAAEWLTRATGIRVSPRTLEHWEAGRRTPGAFTQRTISNTILSEPEKSGT